MIKPNDSPESDRPLKDLLQSWKVQASLPPRFQEAVWRRIEHAQAQQSKPVWNIKPKWIGTMLPRPALAFAYVSVLFALGGTVGWTQAHQDRAHVKVELSERYVRVLDPYLAPRR